MHYCLVTTAQLDLPGTWGGVATHSRMLAAMLTARGHKVTVISHKKSGQPDSRLVNNVTYVAIPQQSGIVDAEWPGKLRAAFIELHAKEPVDIILTEGYWAFGLHELEERIPIVAFVHNFHITHFFNNFTEIDGIHSALSYAFGTVPRLISNILRYEAPFYRRADALLVVSELNAGLLRKFYGASRARAFYNWIDTTRYFCDRRSGALFRKKLSIPDDALVFLLSGSLWKPKGFHIAIKAFLEIEEKHKNAVLLIAGKGGFETELKRIAAPSNNIRFLGLVQENEMPALYNCSDVFLMPSLFSEGMAYALLEAMACGKCCVATNLGGNPESLAEAGLLVKRNSVRSLYAAMDRLASDRALIDGYSKKALERITGNFSAIPAEKAFFAAIDGLKAGR